MNHGKIEVKQLLHAVKKSLESIAQIKVDGRNRRTKCTRILYAPFNQLFTPILLITFVNEKTSRDTHESKKNRPQQLKESMK